MSTKSKTKRTRKDSGAIQVDRETWELIRRIADQHEWSMRGACWRLGRGWQLLTDEQRLEVLKAVRTVNEQRSGRVAEPQAERRLGSC